MERQLNWDASNASVCTDQDLNRWAKWMHWSLYVAYFIPILGLPVPIVLWQMKKKRSPYIDAQGKVVANWMINLLLYLIMFIFGLYKVAGFFGCALLFLIAMIYPIIGGRNAKQGKVWEYPLVGKFFR